LFIGPRKRLNFLVIFFTCGTSRAMKNLHIICTKMLLGFGRDLGIDMTREKDGKNNTKESSKKRAKITGKWQLFFINQCSSLIQINKLEGEGGEVSFYFFLLAKQKNWESLTGKHTRARSIDFRTWQHIQVEPCPFFLCKTLTPNFLAKFLFCRISI